MATDIIISITDISGYKFQINLTPVLKIKLDLISNETFTIFFLFALCLTKKIYKGGFMYKNTNEDDITDFFWICRNNKPKDFATLLRFTIMTKLTRSGSLHTRTFISSDG